VATLVAAAGMPAIASGQEFVLTNQQFDMWLTNNNRSATDQITSQVKMEISELDHICDLSPEQKKKLRLAGRGDAARFESEVAALRAELVDKSYSNEEVNEIFQRIQPLQQKFQSGLLGERSLFHRIVARTLDERQRVEYEARQAQRRSAVYEARVRMYVAMLDRAVPMRDEQRQDLMEQFKKHTQPPKRFGQNPIYYVMYQASKLPEEGITKIFDEAQLPVVKTAFQQGSRYKSMLIQQGFVLDEEEPASAPAKTQKKKRAAKEAVK
jgi:hypothetical protein